ncbi:hypothetical protein C8R43DRAFT_562464 [Mycena crocata]|nr:hypothetical protein C8R43DRAFT_562464 [Mycena crocata]
MGVLASEIFEGPSTTRTIPIYPPIAFSQTYEAAASGLRNSDAFGGETCGWGGDGWGTCVQEAVHGSTTVAATFSGTGFFYTNAVQLTETKPVSSTLPPPSPTDYSSFIPPTNSVPAPSTSPPAPNAAIGSNGPSLYMWICCTIMAGALLSV